jgi:DNA-binding CsgD family transcriptional regulator
MNGLREMSIHGGMTVAAWGRAGRVGIADAYGNIDSIRALSPWASEQFYLATVMTFRTIERLSLVSAGAALTRREVEILDLAAQGLTTRSIASRLQIVEQTVKFHLKGIRVKLNARNRSEAIARFAVLDFSASWPGQMGGRDERRPALIGKSNSPP